MKSITIPCLAMILLSTPGIAGNDYTYLALGDSIPFGMNITLLPPYSQQTPTPAQFVGYPEAVAAATRLLESKKEANASCPGETSGSFLNTSVPDNGCNSPHYQAVGPAIPPFKTTIGLHMLYTVAQMDFAEAQLASNKHINLVTLSIGANDVLMALPALEQCKDDGCVQTLMVPLLNTYGSNLAQILTRIRAQYQGTLVVMTYYSPSPALDGITIVLNSTMMKVAANFGVSIADGFGAFQLASALYGGDACPAGLLIKLPASPPSPTPCDVHPSPMGRDLLAATVTMAVGTPPAAIAAVNAVYAGPDIAQNTWVEIHGSGLAPSDVGPSGFDWSTAPDFASGRMPTQLKGVSVKVNGKPAYIYWISPTQVNVLVPLDNTQGPVQVQLTNGSSTTAPFASNMKALAPSFFLLGATKYIVGQHADYSLMGPVSMSVPGYTFSPAKPGETIILYATGFSLPVVTLVDGSATQSGALPNLPLVQVGAAAATVAFAGVISPGLYQINVVVPASSANGDNTVTASYAGFTTQAGAVISVQR